MVRLTGKEYLACYEEMAKRPSSGDDVKDAIAAYESMVETVVAARVRYPSLMTSIAGDDGQSDPHVSRVVARCAELRSGGERAVVRLVSVPDADGRHAYYSCVVQRADGTLETQDARC